MATWVPCLLRTLQEVGLGVWLDPHPRGMSPGQWAVFGAMRSLFGELSWPEDSEGHT